MASLEAPSREQSCTRCHRQHLWWLRRWLQGWHGWHLGGQDCPELRGEAVDYLQRQPGGVAAVGAPRPPTVLAVDATCDASDLAALQSALLEVRSRSSGAEPSPPGGGGGGGGGGGVLFSELAQLF